MNVSGINVDNWGPYKSWAHGCSAVQRTLQTEDPDPEKAAALKRSGDEAFVAREFSRAATCYDESLRHDVSNHFVWANLSAARLRLGEAEQALTSARTARALQPKYLKVTIHFLTVDSRCSVHPNFCSGASFTAL